MSQRHKPTRADASLSLVIAPSKFCPRKLVPGMVKRYMSKGPLIAYMVACPSCGFTEMHLQEKAGFVEHEGALVEMKSPVCCMVCHRHISVVDRGALGVFIEAHLAPVVPLSV